MLDDASFCCVSEDGLMRVTFRSLLVFELGQRELRRLHWIDARCSLTLGYVVC